MEIAILGWGSLVWDPRELPREGSWQTGGQRLPLEFSRVSTDCRLTLVIDLTHGEWCPTRFVMSRRTDIDDTICDVRAREGTTSRNIGFVDLGAGTGRGRSGAICSEIRNWCAREGLDGAVWTDLCPNFEDQTGNDYSVGNAVAYLEGLPKAGREAAFRYIRNAPHEVNTSLRRELERSGLLSR